MGVKLGFTTCPGGGVVGAYCLELAFLIRWPTGLVDGKKKKSLAEMRVLF